MHRHHLASIWEPNWLKTEANSVSVVVPKERTRHVYVMCLFTDNYRVGVRLALEIRGFRGN